MAINLYDFGITIKAIDAASAVIRRVEQGVEKLNTAVKNTARYREAAANMAMIGAGAVAMGGAMAYGLKQMIDPAMKVQAEWQHVATAVNDGAATIAHLNQAREYTEKLAVQNGIAAVQEAEGYYIARSNMLSHADALEAVARGNDLVIGTTQTVTDANLNAADTIRTLTSLHNVFGGALAANADQLAKLQSAYSFKDISEVNYALAAVMTSAHTAGLSATQMNAALAIISAKSGLHGQRAGIALEEVLNKALKKEEFAPFVRMTKQGGLDLIATFQAVSKASQGMSPVRFDQWAMSLGFTERSLRGFSALVNNVGQFAAVEKDLDNSKGAAAHLAAIREASADYSVAKLGEGWDQLKVSLGTLLLPEVIKLVNRMTALADWMNEFTKNHPKIVSMGLKVAALTSGVLLLGGALSLASAAMLGFVSFGPALKEMVTTLRIGTIATKAWEAAQWVLNAAMAGNVFVLVIIGALALAAVAYEVIKHWKQISTFFKGLGGELYTAGVHLVDSLVSGITSRFHTVAGAMERVGSTVRSYLPFSPAKEGPLRDLNRIRFVETIAQSIRPGPMIDAIRKVAAASAIAIPMAIGGGAGQVMARTGGPSIVGSGVTVNVTVNYTIAPGAASTAGDFRKLLEDHADTIGKVVARQVARTERLKY
jgi:TP901 family phage tail tape measure protein